MINTELDWSAIQKEYATNGNVVIRDILNFETANAIAGAISDIDQWDLNCSGREKAVILPEQDFLSLPPERRMEISRELMLVAQARYAFHFYQHAIKNSGNRNLREFYENLYHEQFLGFLKYVTGEFSIAGRVGMATQYRPGCFLRTHSDLGETKERLFAYIFGFTRDWKPDWGGTLNLLDAEGNPVKTINPGFNTLTLLKVPTDHFVSQVANYATKHRYSITGWFLRA